MQWIPLWFITYLPNKWLIFVFVMVWIISSPTYFFWRLQMIPTFSLVSELEKINTAYIIVYDFFLVDLLHSVDLLNDWFWYKMKQAPVVFLLEFSLQTGCKSRYEHGQDAASSTFRQGRQLIIAPPATIIKQTLSSQITALSDPLKWMCKTILPLTICGDF